MFITMAQDEGVSEEEQRTEPVRVLVLGGSLRERSYTRALSNEVANAIVHARGAPTQWDLRASPLPMADPRFHRDPSVHTDDRVRRLVALACDCDAFVLASPVYHNSYSGLLKNALDVLAIRQFAYKPVGLVSHGGNRSTQAVDHLRIVVRGLRAVAVPTQVCTADDDYGDSQSRLALVAPDVHHRLRLLATELTVMALQFRALRNLMT